MHDFPISPMGLRHKHTPGRSPGLFGRRTTARVAAHTSIGAHQLLHLCWDFLTPTDRLSCTKVYPIMTDYARLRRDACVHRHTISAHLRAPRPPPPEVQPLCPIRTWFMGAALLSFNFDHRAVILWLRGEYTNENRNWEELAKKIGDVCQHQPDRGYPRLYPDIAMRAFTEGVPLQGVFISERSDMIRRLQYDNHPPVQAAADEVRKKFAREEANSFHVTYPKFTALFIPGLMLSPISWIVQKGKGRLIVDASTKLGPADTGPPNIHIPAPGAPGRYAENPPVFYGTALRRHLTAVWNMRISHPDSDLLQHTDDIDSAFRRVLYHPDMAVVFGYVFQDLLLIPVGNIFGSRNAPSWFTTPAELRAHMANWLRYNEDDYQLACQLEVPPEPDIETRATFVRAVPDDHNTGRPSVPGRPGHHSMFVDDNICVATRAYIRQAVAGAIGSAYDCFGDPLINARRGSVLAAEKFDPIASHRVTFVGYIIDSRSMRIHWPLEKREKAAAIIQDWLQHRTSRSPAQISQLLGLLRHGIAISTAGNFLSIRLQLLMSHQMVAVPAKKLGSKGWWHRHRIRVPPEVLRDLRIIHATLQEPLGERLWSRPIGLLVPRSPTAIVLSDASYGGIGGWSTSFNFLWRITRDELLLHGFAMKEIDSTGEAVRDPSNPDADDLHINILEFVGIIINIWVCIAILRDHDIPTGGHVIRVLADNTSALSWLRHAARARRAAIRNLAYLCQCLLLFSQTSDHVSFLGLHIPGKKNGEADALSRPEDHPSLDSAIAAFSQLQSCHVFQLPSSLLSTLARVISSTEIEAGGLLVPGLLSSLSPRQALTMIGVYVHEVAGGHNITGRDDLADDTIRQYLSAAATVLRFQFGVEVPIFTTGTGHTQADKLDPYLAEILASRRTWKRSAPKKEAFSAEMLAAMYEMAREATLASSMGWLSRDAVLYDFVSLGIFTGSRLAEYGQSVLKPGSKPDAWNVIPDNPDVPREWRRRPIAFMACDLKFYSGNKILLSHDDVCADPRRPSYVSIRFRYDKSKFNFIYRQFKRVKHSTLCAVAAAARIIRRGQNSRLLNPSTEPLGMFLGKNGQRYSIRGHHVAKFLKEACERAHPDPQHYMRLHIDRLMAHCIRVTAAVLLSNAGVEVDDISFRLRWNSDAVKLYLRDNERLISDITSKVVAGAFQGSASTA